LAIKTSPALGLVGGEIDGVFAPVFESVPGDPSKRFEEFDFPANGGSPKLGIHHHISQRRPAKPGRLVRSVRQSDEHQLGLWVCNAGRPCGVQVWNAHGWVIGKKSPAACQPPRKIEGTRQGKVLGKCCHRAESKVEAQLLATG
jgi:hypothetical protein